MPLELTLSVRNLDHVQKGGHMSQRLRSRLSIGAVALGALLALGACTELGMEKLADCVEVYSGTGATRRPGFTRTACEDHCKSVQGALDCYWDG